MGLVLPLLIVTLAEASIGVFVKLVGTNVPIFTLNFYRVLFAAIFLAAGVPLLTKHKLKFPKHNTKDILIVGGLIALQISFFNVAMSLAPIANVVIFWSVAPFFAFIFSTIFLKEKPKKVHILIFLIAIAGIIIAKPLDGGHALGNLIALADGAVYAAMVTYLRSEGITEDTVDIFWFMTMASVYLLPFLFIFGPGELGKLIPYEALGASIPVIVWVVCLGMISTGLAFLFISEVLKKIDANVYSLIDIIVSPVVAALLGYLIFTEIPSKNMIFGAALLLISGFWLTKELQRKPTVNPQPLTAAHTTTKEVK
ncbi:MAG: DMT family transporter [Candidatus Woesearchaeota archaeon]